MTSNRKVFYIKPHRKVERGDFIFPHLLPPEEYMYDEDSDDIEQEDEDGSYSKPIRYQWSNKLQFVLACVGYSVGLGSVWRFPYLCYKSGGGVFLIPYFISMLVCGVPMLYMELAVGQYTGRGPIGALGHLCPLFKGTGLGSVVISFLMSTYYSVIIAYGIYYFFTSFKSNQPWADCNHRWNTKHCWVLPKSDNTSAKPMNSQTPSEEFFEIKVLQAGPGIEHFHQLRWELVACLICAWVLVYFAIWKSIKSSGRVRYFTATFPFLLILLFLAKSLTLEGADRGLRYFFKPKWSLLGEAKVWVNAAAQTFNSMGIAFGSMISFASYNKYNNNILQDTVAVSVVNLVTSLLVGVFAFATIGNIATEHNTSIEDVITDGPGLIFVVYPQAIAQMPAANLWAILFFFMLLCLALNSQFATVEVVVTSIHDGFPVWIKNHLMCHEILVLVVCLISAVFGLPYVTKSGIYFFQLMDHYTATISKMYLAFFEVVAIAWVYGGRRLSRNVKTMTGKHPGWYFKFCWVIATPLMIVCLWVFLLIDYAPPTYNNGSYEFPDWAIVMGWLIASVSLLCIPIFMVYVFLKTPGESIMDKLKNSIKPDLEEKCLKCGDVDCDCVLEETMQPMLVLQSSDARGKTSGPTYIPIQTLEIPRNNGIVSTENSNLKRDSLESGHHRIDPVTIHVETTPPSDSSLSSKESKT
ncbi:sodium- and chloride-dependent GABA transporter ine-like isoform X2 [Coccinella septempunctata]|uniref:sodium- and chloride-dependent GABA transporter ine-like isoform X2 n=1 Tax=Coccinella septempunctata TaxID=41139 RepID=UPI001D0930B5|nr:sodium- and chloride-dependent GABA transporter ine-like isoform X2 [Coccinella septempunctata]